jgi:hypothetical protein
MEINNKITEEDFLSLVEQVKETAIKNNLTFGFERELAEIPGRIGMIKVGTGQYELFVKNLLGNEDRELFEGVITLGEYEMQFKMYLQFEKMINDFIKNYDYN